MNQAIFKTECPKGFANPRNFVFPIQSKSASLPSMERNMDPGKPNSRGIWAKLCDGYVLSLWGQWKGGSQAQIQNFSLGSRPENPWFDMVFWLSNETWFLPLPARMSFNHAYCAKPVGKQVQGTSEFLPDPSPNWINLGE